MVVKLLEKNFLALKLAHFGPFCALKWVLGNYFNFDSFYIMGSTCQDPDKQIRILE